jgi:hypothetical protein
VEKESFVGKFNYDADIHKKTQKRDSKDVSTNIWKKKLDQLKQ